MPVAAPAILAGVLHHRGANRVEFDIAHAGEQIGFGLHHAGFIAPFLKAAGATIAAVDVLHVASADGLHELGDSILVFWRDQQVNVVGHQGIGMDVAVPIDSRFFQPVEVEVIILLGKETGRSIDSALNNVLWYSG